ncbi:sensor histidine kinase [Pelatocladus sp. BLCC-F211]|uniref:sensor histidine kinase n=1 Tax=Pelatocladus sp. BLCC-F211 TaxID=3342752 RepID=UPI0035BA8C45
MNLLANRVFSFRSILRWVEWVILLANLFSGLISNYFQEHPHSLPLFIAFNIAFFLLSFIFPLERPLWQRRVFIAVEIILIISAVWLRFWFTIFMYFVLAKSCFFLSRRDVILTAIFTGIGYLSGEAWYLPQRIAETVAQLQSRGSEHVYDAKAILLTSLLDYIGASLFIILLGFVIVAERKSKKRAESLAKEVETLAATLERTRIAREIHDSLGHTLTTLDVQLELAQKLHQRDPAQTLQALDTAKYLSSQCLQDVRRAVQTMRRSDFNLNQALSALVTQIQQNQSFTVQADLNLPPLPLQTSHQLYCIIQEGLTNIQKHAIASHVILRGQFTLDAIILELEDDGQGFDPDSPHSGFGLRGMQERIQILDGKLSIKSTPAQGTHIWITVPR